MFKCLNSKGFTLIEMMVAVSVFVLMVTAASGLFVSSLRAQKQSLAYQELLDQTSYFMEYMSRAIRMARKELSDSPVCLSVRGLNYEKTRNGRGLKFINYDGICQEFFLDETTDRLKEIKGGQENFLTSDNLRIEVFNTELVGQSQNDDLQPRATIFLKIERREGLQIKIQTTISQRNLDIRK